MVWNASNLEQGESGDCAGSGLDGDVVAGNSVGNLGGLGV